MLNLWLETIGTIIANSIQFLLIPVIWWHIFYRKKQSLNEFIGLTSPKLNSIWLLLGFVVIYFIFLQIDFVTFFEKLSGTDAVVMDEIMVELSGNEAMQTNTFVGIGFAALLPAFFHTFIANGLCEEVFFRGFVLKRFQKLLGTWAAIIIAGALFSILHNVMFLIVGIEISFLHHLGMFVAITIGGILFGVLNEIVFNGKSVLPSVLLHGLANFLVTVKAIISYY